jgi:hypothetical protein
MRRIRWPHSRVSPPAPGPRLFVVVANGSGNSTCRRVGVALRGHYSPVMVVRLCVNSLMGRKVASGNVVEFGSASQLRHCLRVDRYTGGTCRSAQPALPCRLLPYRAVSPSRAAGRTDATRANWVPGCPLPGGNNGSILGGPEGNA